MIWKMNAYVKRFYACALVVLCVYLPFDTVHATCGSFSTVSVIEKSEQAVNGTKLFNLTKGSGDSVSFDISGRTDVGVTDRPELKTFFDLIIENTSFSLNIARVLDLELFHQRFHRNLTNIVLKFTCGGIPNNEVTIAIKEVNEFPPVFVGTPYNTTIKESAAVGSVIYNLNGKVTDEDVPQRNTFVYKIVPHQIGALDGRDIAQIPTATTGKITLAKAIDYDTAQHKPFIIKLNVSVSDSSVAADAITRYTTIDINIEDVDDQEPYFDYPNCGLPCTAPPYETLTELDKTGLLTVEPVPITAKDNDTLNTRLVYSIESGNDYGLFSIGENNGNVTQLMSVRHSGLSDKEFRIVVKVRKNITKDLSAIAILTIGVKERLPFRNDTNYPDTGESKLKDNGNTDLLIPVIILGVALLLVIVAIIVIMVVIKRKQRKMTVGPEHDKSEPQTEEEDIHTDRSDDYNTRCQSNERLVFNGKATLGIGTDDFPTTPNGKAGQLPPLPLRDSATETTEGRKKKRSRRRNKNKEPEIFDGTKEYNMGMNPEFFDSTDKSKVKRSQRSYDKKSDPALRLQIPNDNAEEE